MRTSLFRRWAVAAVAVGLIASGCSGDDDSSSSSTTTRPGVVKGEGDRYEATIRRDAAGVAHITGETLADATFGQGWASGEDRACDLADQIIEVTSQRARWFGPGEDDAHIRSDVSWKAIGIVDVAKADWDAAGDDVKELITAYADGWNAQLDAVGADGINDWCAGEPWVQPVEPLDVYTYARSIALLASGGAVSSMLATAAPPEPAPTAGSDEGGDVEATPASLGATVDGLAQLDGLEDTTLASNGWAIGKDRATDGGGMLVGNPHFPWEGELRFWEVHLTVPGELDIYGVQLSGLPGVGIGFNEHFGWTHTVSSGNRFTAYRLDLVDGDPTRYVYGDETKSIEPTEVTIEVLGDDGEVTEEQRTIWRSHYGPMLDFPGVGWSDSMAITMRDANIDNDEFIVQYLRMTTAKDLDEAIEINREVTGVPLFNTIATSADGRAWYADTSATPALSDEALATLEELLETDPLVKAAADNGAILLDGSDPTFEWEERPGARDPGLVPFDEMPSTTRDDYVFNANDSYWVSNAQELLDGDFSPLHGRRDVPQSFRTRENARVLDDTTPLGPSGADGTFTLDELADAAVLNRGFAAAELLEDVIGRCEAAAADSTVVQVAAVMDDEGDEVIAAGSVDVAEACAVLTGWDGIYDLDRAGPPLWRETLKALGDALDPDGAVWATPFDAADPLATPGGLAPAPDGADDPMLVALGRAVKVLELAELEVDVELGEVQQARRGDDLVPVHGGEGIDGVPNIVSFARNWSTLDPTLLDLERTPLVPGHGIAEITDADGRTTTGYRINYGSSFLFALAYGPDGPQAKAFLTYGNTADRSSKAYVDATKAFSDKAWRDVAFTEADVAAATTSTATVRG